jgi:hypothetical protein
MYSVISANRSPQRAPKNWRVFEKEMLEKHFGKVLDVNGEDGHSVLDAYNRYGDTVKYIRWYPDPELMTNEEYLGMVNQNNEIGNLPYITNSVEGFLSVQSKEEAFKLWKTNNVNCPDFFVYKDKEDFYLQQEKYNIPFPFLIRLNNGVGGKNTYAVRKKKDLDTILNKLDSEYLNYIQNNSRIKTTKMCVQLVDSTDKDRNVNLSFRIHVAGNRVVSGYARVVDGNDWLAITAGKFNIEHIDNWVYYNQLCESIMSEYEEELCRAIEVLGLNHQGIDVIIDQSDNTLCFLEVQPTYASGYPQEGYCGYVKPFYNPNDPSLVKFLQQNENDISKLLPRYYYNWLDKKNHFDLVYKSVWEYLNVRS